MLDDFGDNVAEQEESRLGALAHKKRRGATDPPGPASGSVVACPIPECLDSKEPKKRLCLRHQRLFDVMRYQAKAESEEQLKKFNEQMTDQDVMVEEVMKFAAHNADTGDARKKKKMDWTEFNQRRGVVLMKSSHVQTAPFEKKQWVIRQVNKFGRDKTAAEERWAQCEGSSFVKRDMCGDGGQLRLWLPSKEFQDDAFQKYIEGVVTSGGERKKNPKQQTIDALHNHAHDMFNAQGITKGDSFFLGASLGSSKRSREAQAAELPGGPGDGDDGGSDDGDGVVDQQRGKNSSDKVISIVNLSDSEDENPNPKAKVKSKCKKRKSSVNLTDMKAGLIRKVSEGKNLGVRLKEAAEQLQAEANTTAAGDKTEILTRSLKKDAIEKLSVLAKVLLGHPDPGWPAAAAAGQQNEQQQQQPDEVKVEPSEPVGEDKGDEGAEEEDAAAAAAVEDEAAGEKAETEAPAAAATQAGASASAAAASGPAAHRSGGCVLQRALDLCAKAHGIGLPHHVRDFQWMTNFCDSIVEQEAEEQVEKSKLVWRRLDTAMSAFNASFKNANASMNKYLAKREADRLKAEMKTKEAADRERLSKEKKDLDSRAKKLATAGAVVPAFYSVDRSSFTGMPKVNLDSVGASFDTRQPVLIVGRSLLEEYLTKPMVQQVLTGFGGKYKKLDGFKEDGKASSTLLVRQGKEETEAFYNKLLKALSLHPMNLSSVSAAWNTTSWLWGLRPTTYNSTSTTPNGAAYLRIIAMGELEIWVGDTACIVEKLAEMKITYEGGLDGLYKVLEALTDESWQALKGQGVTLYYHRLRKEDIVFVPVGSVVLEKAGDVSLIYGLRKSFFIDSADNKKAYQSLCALTESAGQNVKKMEAVAALFS